MKAIWTAVRETPRRLVDAFTDPVRRRHIAAKALESGAGALAAGVVVALAGNWAVLAAPGAGVLVDWLVYEWITEPLGWAGHYWERGPRDDETFKNW